MAPAGMGKRGHLPPLEMLCFCAFVVTAKRSVDALFFCIILHKLSLASEGNGP